MRSLVLTLLLSFVFISGLRAQDSTRLERFEYVVGASLGFSLFDYVGYNLVKHDKNITLYRLLQGTVQAAITYFLYEKLGLTSALSFTLLWWTWVDDVAYDGWANVINPGRPWENRSFHTLQSTEISWAGWTPIGLLRPKHSNIARDALLAQAVVGLSISLAILW
jgi:hypothetical protein